MFDMGFSEILLIALVALVVIGPEKLPKVARTLGYMLGRVQRYMADVKADIGREMELDELRRMREEFEMRASAFEMEMRQKLAAPALGEQQEQQNEIVPGSSAQLSFDFTSSTASQPVKEIHQHEQ
ncbi:MAG: twin-arginine translocase subunit TatB [Pseudomonadota bacterium]|nr:twin-arginine translocase subunit TatB [Pseudomonadota bacterium]